MPKRGTSNTPLNRRIRSKIPRPFGPNHFWPPNRIETYGFIQLTGMMNVAVNDVEAADWQNPFNVNEIMRLLVINQVRCVQPGGSATPWTGDPVKQDFSFPVPSAHPTSNYLARYDRAIITDVAWMIDFRQPDSASSDVEVGVFLSTIPNTPPSPGANYGGWHYARPLPYRQHALLSQTPNLITSVRTLVGTVKMHKLASLTRSQYMADPNNWIDITIPSGSHTVVNQYYLLVLCCPPSYVLAYASEINLRATLMVRMELFEQRFSHRVVNN